MRTLHPLGLMAVTLGLCVAAARASAANTVPYAESFEGYTNGTLIVGTNGWTGEQPDAGVVTTNAMALGALAAYTNGTGLGLPLTDSHLKVLEVRAPLTNAILSATGGVVVTDVMVMPSRRDTQPTGYTNFQYALYVDTNGQLVVWHRNLLSATNEWVTLTGTALASDQWCRITIHQDFSNQMYQIQTNGAAAVTSPAGWTGRGGSHPGSWFYMVQTNGYLSRLRTQGDITSYVDDLVVSGRWLRCSGTGFSEAPANDGTIAAGDVVSFTLQYGLFNATNGADLVAAGKLAVSNLPAGLVAAAVMSNTTVRVTLGGRANAHAAADGVHTLAFAFQDTAFALGRAADVAGSTRGGFTVTFADAPVLSYGATAFSESTANDGSIDNSHPLTITLAGETFTGTNGDDFVTAGKAVVSNLPPGLVAVMTRVDTNQVAVTLTNRASAHGSANSVTNLAFMFGDTAFSTVAASNIPTATRADLRVVFADSPVLTYASTVYPETAANDGSVTGGTISLAAESFTGTNGDDLVTAGKVLVSHLPAGLTAVVTRTASQLATVSFLGRAAAHANADDVNDFGLAFRDGAFWGGSAAAVSNATRGDLRIDFRDPPVVTAVPSAFAEGSSNNGAIANSVTLSLADETFSNGVFVSGQHFSATGVPAGLTAVLTVANPTQVVVTLQGRADSHAAGNSATLALSLLDAAFTQVAAGQIVNSTTHLQVNFDDAPVLTYSRAVFAELSEGQIDNTTPMSISLSGDAFAGADGQDLVAAGHVQVTNLPAGLTAVLTRVGAQSVAATLTGTAAANSAADSVSNLTFTFVQGAFMNAQADQVVNYARSDLRIDFTDVAGVVNVLPYEESFEEYADGLALAGTNGWQAVDRLAAVVTGAGAVAAGVTNLTAVGYPILTNHTQVLRLDNEVSDEIRSGEGHAVYADFLLYAVARQEQPQGSTNYQYALYIDTNQTPVIWHRAASGSNEWLALAQSAPVTTEQWHRVTIQHDYTNGMFRLRIDRLRWVEDATGWTLPGRTHPGEWFSMVQTNAYFSRFRFQNMRSDRSSYIDDLAVRESAPGYMNQRGVVFVFR